MRPKTPTSDGSIVPAPRAAWFTDELQSQLIDALSTGLKPRWVAFYCGVAPKALMQILDLGARRDAVDPFRGFCVRWTRAEAQLMHDKVEEWRLGDYNAFTFLRERWPKVWGKDAESDYEVLGTVSTSEEIAQFEEILSSPESFGVAHLFDKHGWVRREK